MDGGFICWKSGDQINWKFLPGPFSPFPPPFLLRTKRLGKEVEEEGEKKEEKKNLDP